MKKKNLQFSYYLILSICLLYIILSAFLQITYYKFDSQNVKNNIQILTDKKYSGRLTGSSGNDNASIFIENAFRNYNLQPLKSNYRENLDVITPIINNTTPSLTISFKDKTINQYCYGTDFKENMLNFKSSNAIFTKEDNVEILTDSIMITQNDKKYLFKANPNKDFDFRSSFNCNSQYEFCINITTELYNDILNSLRNGYNISVNLPYTTTLKSTSNIIGVINGNSKSLPPLILTAHYDHLGIDGLGNYYNGALDNASGTAFLIELSKSLSSLVRPKRDIIFVALTGEEFGLLGSKNFVSNHINEIGDSTVINFDMIGAPNTPISFIIGTATDRVKNIESIDILNSLKSQCVKNNIKYDVKIQDSSDHASFNNAGINALTICHSDLSRIHTPKDTAEYISSVSIDQVYSIVQEEIYNSSYNKYILLFYNPAITLIITIILISMIIIKNNQKLYKFLISKK